MQWHVALGAGLLVALSLAAVVAVTSDAITRRAMAGARQDLAAARAAFWRLVEDRAREASVQANLIARLPVVRAHMIDPQLAADAPTLDAMAAEYRTQLGAAFLVVGTSRSSVTGRDGYPGSQLHADVSGVLAEAGAGEATRRVVAIDGVLHLVVAEPARFVDEVLGALVVGYVLDDAVMRDLAAITRCDVSLVAEGSLMATSLGGPFRGALDTLVRTGALPAKGGPSLRAIEDAEYVAAVYPLTHDAAADVAGQLVLLQDWAPTRQSLDGLRRQLALGGLVVFVAALGGGLVFSGRVTRSLAGLSHAAGEMAAGDWERQLPEHGSAEVQSLARAVNAMATSLRRHHADVEAHRLRVFRATMTTVHDLVNNFLANMQFIRMEAEGRLPQETLDLFDRLIDDNAVELQLLGGLEVVREKKMAVGTGIEYPSAASRDVV